MARRPRTASAWRLGASLPLFLLLILTVVFVQGDTSGNATTGVLPARAEDGVADALMADAAFSEDAPATPDPTPEHFELILHLGPAKWLLWPAILYFFWAQSLVCDEYFVPAVQVCAETFNIPDDVAGATIMALGCNGPELFINVIALFITNSDVGVGTIVGSDVFNLLLICGCSVLVAPGALVLQKATLSRDLFFYALSIGLLYWVIHDGDIPLYESCVLGGSTLIFAFVVGIWSRLERALGMRRDGEDAPSADAPDTPADGVVRSSSERMTPTAAMTPTSAMTAFISKIKRGVWLQVRQGGHVGRLQSRWRPYVKRFVRVDGNGNLTMARAETLSLGNSSISEDGPGNAPIARSNSAPSTADILLPLRPRPQSRHSQELLGGIRADLFMGDALGITVLHPIDVISIEPSDEALGFQILCRPNTANPIGDPTSSFTVRSAFCEGSRVWEFRVDRIEDRQKWVDALQTQLQSALEHPTIETIAELEKEHREVVEAAVHGSTRHRNCCQRLWSVVEWFCFPVVFILEVTVPECHVEARNRWRWPITFTMSMTWLALFSWVLCLLVEMVGTKFGLSDNLLGLTLAAAGTSFPNLIASVLVAKRGQCKMAIANAIGSNIQNVFLALGWPWIVKSWISPDTRFKQDANGVISGVIWMAGTLVLFIVIVILGRGTLKKSGAYLMILTYALFLADCIYEEVKTYKQ